MKRHVLLLLLLALNVMLPLGAAVGTPTIQLNDDVLGLIVFKSGFRNAAVLDSWNEDDESPCAWEFVTCNDGNGRVSGLALDGLGLTGKIGRGLEKLTSLKLLSLSGNNLTGRINPELALVPNLQKLNLSKNSLSGDLPESFCDISSSSLQFLDLSGNSLTGVVSDAFFGKCSSLRYVSLSGNHFQGPIPTAITNSTVLNHLNLSDNRFSGDLNFVWSLPRLRTLDLSNNALSGSIPIGMAFVHNLKEVVLGGNQLSGVLPADIGLCPHLTRVDVSSNLLTGAIPESLQRLTALSYLSISNNLITGEFPQWIGQLSSLEYLDLSNNNIIGSLPSSISHMKSLRLISLSKNRFSGAIPETLVNISGLSVVRLGGNAFDGGIPEGLFDMELEEMDLSRNGLTGSIPAGSGKIFETLEVLDLSGNYLVGNIPAEMGLFNKLRYLNLSWNRLESRIPPELGYIQNLTVLDLRNSGLIGSIPGDVCDSGSLAILQLDGNLLTGPIPKDIGNCSSLYLLTLSHNNLTGMIPSSISLLRKLKILKLEVNELSGEMPQELGKLDSLLIANVSYNRLVGRLPAGGIFQTLDASAIEGNLGICSPLLKGPCKMNVPKPLVLDPYAYGDNGQRQGRRQPEGSRFRHRNFLSVSAIIAISAAALIAVGVLLITLLNASARRRLALVENALESMCSSSTRSANLAAGKLIVLDSKLSSPSPDWLSGGLDSVLNKASEIGAGVFGTVYKVASAGRQAGGGMLAIKKLVTTNTLQYQEEFDREVRILAKAKHPNLIQLKGYYWTPQLQLLVTDYASQGSLQAKLHHPSPASPPLAWPNRFKIVMGTAKGLAYLHHSFRPPIIHYDIKPSNIVLDQDLNPKISDFGLSRLLTKLDKHVANNRFQSAPGYVAPELACQSLRVNEKCDVYGFGVLILELVTGRRPVEYGEDNVVILSDHVRALLEQGNVLECVDMKMGKYPEEEVLPVLKLALVCTSQIPSSRPSMAEVVQILEVIQAPLPNRSMEAAAF